MPRLDGTGPQGRGPMTGRGAGRCNPHVGEERPPAGFGFGRFFKPVQGLGRGLGRVFGRGIRRDKAV